MLIALRHLYKNIVLPENERKPLTLEAVSRMVSKSEAITRKNYIRRVYHNNKLFALEEIKQKYPGYSEAMLLADLQKKKGIRIRKKIKPVSDIRRSQLVKLARLLDDPELDSRTYDQTCCKIVMLQNAHDQKLPVPLTIRYGGESLVYYFPWKIREDAIKSFVAKANEAGMSHEMLKRKHQEIISSAYSF